MERDSFIFYNSFRSALKDVPKEIKYEVYDAIIEYGITNQTPTELSVYANMAFALILPQLEANQRRYENGKKGGRPTKEKTEIKPKRNLNETKVKPNKNDNVNKNVNDNDNKKDNVNVNVNEKELKVAEATTLIQEDVRFVNFKNWLSENAPRVLKMTEPITQEQYLKIIEDFSDRGQEVQETLQAMHNYKDITKRISANLTLRNWLNRNNNGKANNGNNQGYEPYNGESKADREYREYHENRIKNDLARIVDGFRNGEVQSEQSSEDGLPF